MPLRLPRSRLLQWSLQLAALAGLWLWFTRHPSVPVSSLLPLKGAQPVTRAEVIAIARSYAEHRWTPAAENIRHGCDRNGVAIDTPDAPPGRADGTRWFPGRINTGLPYKWGGFDTPASFDAGLRASLAAGDMGSWSKRRAGDAAVSDEAVGIDCSGFISRCWRLPQKYGTATLPGLCQPVASFNDLQPGDILDIPHRHVLLFAEWSDSSKTQARFYEAEGDPHACVVLSEHHLWWLRLLGAKPLRYGLIGR